MNLSHVPASHDWDDVGGDTHSASETEFTSIFGPHFSLLVEVCLENTRGKKLRIDRLMFDARYMLGVEIKPRIRFMQQYTAALKQAADYRDAYIVDERLPQFAKERLSAVLVFPRWTGLHNTGEREYAFEAVGMELLAAKFRVGAAGQQKGQPAICIGQARVWTAKNGWSKNADGILLGKRPIGAGRQFDG